MFFFAKALQAIAVINVGYGLYVGITSEAGMWKELELTLTGLVVFYVGRLIERRA